MARSQCAPSQRAGSTGLSRHIMMHRSNPMIADKVYTKYWLVLYICCCYGSLGLGELSASFSLGLAYCGGTTNTVLHRRRFRGLISWKTGECREGSARVNFCAVATPIAIGDSRGKACLYGLLSWREATLNWIALHRTIHAACMLRCGGLFLTPQIDIA